MKDVQRYIDNIKAGNYNNYLAGGGDEAGDLRDEDVTTLPLES